MVAVAKAGGQLITYSDRFSYSGMTGAWSPNVKTGLKDISGTSGPATQDNTVSSDGKAAADPAAGDFDVEYTMQTGATRYAPMQPVPPKTVTKTDTKPLYPTSSVVIAKSKLPIPSVQTTVTQSQTASVSSKVNDVCQPLADAVCDLYIYADLVIRRPQRQIRQMIWPSSWRGGRTRYLHLVLFVLIKQSAVQQAVMAYLWGWLSCWTR